MIKKQVTVVGSTTQDIMFYTDQGTVIYNPQDILRQRLVAFEYGAKIHSREVYFSPGGRGANVAASLAALGLRTKLISAVGRDAVGQEILAGLQRRGVDISGVQKKEKMATAFSLVVNVRPDNEHVLFAYRGAGDLLHWDKALIRRINSHWLYLNSLSDAPASLWTELVHHIQHKKMRLAWNPGARELKWGWKKLRNYLGNYTVLIVNRDEALELAQSGQPQQKINNNIKSLFKILHQRQKLTAITDGAKGAYVYDGNKLYRQKASNHRPVNTTGAGDAFGAGLVAGLVRYHGDIDRSLRLALLNSGSVVSKIGAQTGLLHKKDLSRWHL